MSNGPIDEFLAHGQARGWQHVRLLSALPSTYLLDYKSADADGNQVSCGTLGARRSGVARL